MLRAIQVRKWRTMWRATGLWGGRLWCAKYLGYGTEHGAGCTAVQSIRRAKIAGQPAQSKQAILKHSWQNGACMQRLPS